MFELTDQGHAVRGRSAPKGFNVIFGDLELCVTTELLALKTATEAAIWLFSLHIPEADCSCQLWLSFFFLK